MRRTVTLFVVLLVLGAAAPAGAGSTAAITGEDPVGDVVSARGDIDGWSFSGDLRDGTVVAYQARVESVAGQNPVTARSWHRTRSSVRIFWDTAPTAGAEFRTGIHAQETLEGWEIVSRTISLATGQQLANRCNATSHIGRSTRGRMGASVMFADHGYEVRLPRQCLGVPESSVRIRTEMTFEPHSGPKTIDRAPDGGAWSPRLSVNVCRPQSRC